MNNLNVEIFCMILVTILLLDYNSKTRVKNFQRNSYFYCLSISLLILSAVLIVGDLFVLKSVMSFQIIKCLLIMLLSVMVYLIVYNSMPALTFFSDMTSSEIKKRSQTFALVFIIFYLITMIFYYAKFDMVTDYTNSNSLAYLAIIPLIVSFINVLLQFKKLKNGHFLISVTMIPIIFTVLDLTLNCFAFLTIGYALSLLIIYINRVNLSLNYDLLTQVYNRYYFENVIKNYRLRLEYLVIYYIDIDDFKNINDKFGHAEGDNTLKTVANLLSKSIDNKASVYRVGGDEFVILSQINDQKEVTNIKNKIKNNLEQYNSRHDKYILSLSIGCEITNNVKNLESIVQKADSKMYREKSIKKNNIKKN